MLARVPRARRAAPPMDAMALASHANRTPTPACSPACMPPIGPDHLAVGPSSECAPPFGLERRASPTRRVTIHVATCQEDLSWLNCSWHPNLAIRIIHKCTRENPGYRRVKGLLQPRPWAPPPLQREKCMTHADSAHPATGRESEVYLSELIHAHATTADDDLHLFIQGGRGEFDQHPGHWSYMGSADQIVAKLARRGDIGFIGLNGHVHEPMDLCTRRPITTGLQMHALRLNCTERYANPARATFAVSGRRIRAVALTAWRKYHHDLLSELGQKQMNQSHGEGLAGFERLWSSVFSCCWADIDRRRRASGVGGGYRPWWASGVLSAAEREEYGAVGPGGFECYD